MSYTDIDTVKTILQSMPIIFSNIKNERITFTLYEASYLQYTNIDEDTEIVKIIRTITPINESTVLNDSTESSLSSSLIVPNTVVVADALTLETVYVENDDYIIDYDNGKISRTTVGTSIPNGSTVYIWFIPFVQLTGGSDYNINNDEGSINRRAGTSIPNGATVYIDYSHSQGNVSDDMIEEAISQVDDWINKVISTTYVGSTETALGSAATNLVMYLICLSQAQRQLKLAKSTSDDVSKQWINLSERYFNTAQEILASYKYSPSVNSGQTEINELSTFGDRSSLRFGFRPSTGA